MILLVYSYLILICTRNAPHLASDAGIDMPTTFLSQHVSVTNMTIVNQKTTRLAYQKVRGEVREEDSRCRPKSTSHIAKEMGYNNFQFVDNLGCSVSL